MEIPRPVEHTNIWHGNNDQTRESEVTYLSTMKARTVRLSPKCSESPPDEFTPAKAVWALHRLLLFYDLRRLMIQDDSFKTTGLDDFLTRFASDKETVSGLFHGLVRSLTILYQLFNNLKQPEAIHTPLDFSSSGLATAMKRGLRYVCESYEIATPTRYDWDMDRMTYCSQNIYTRDSYTEALEAACLTVQKALTT